MHEEATLGNGVPWCGLDTSSSSWSATMKGRLGPMAKERFVIVGFEATFDDVLWFALFRPIRPGHVGGLQTVCVFENFCAIDDSWCQFDGCFADSIAKQYVVFGARAIFLCWWRSAVAVDGSG